MHRRTKIICTIGPASEQAAMIRKLAQEGMDMVRLNFSHGTHENHGKIIEAIRKVNKTLKKPIMIMQDLEGYRIRLGELAQPRQVNKGEAFWLSSRMKESSAVVPLDADFDLSALKKGMHVYVADGTIDLEVVQNTKSKVKVRVVQGGTISSKKNVNIPGLKLGSNIFTEKDRRDLEFGLDHELDFVAQSFVRNRRDVEHVVKVIEARGAKCKVIAKIENKEALVNIDRIIEVCDGVIIARGDLGVSLPIYEVPVIQKRILHRTNRYGRFDIVATQMLESMTENPRPTRAEVSDVANAIIDGAEAVMLSGETAIGKFPVETVRMMRQIIEFTETSMKIKG